MDSTIRHSNNQPPPDLTNGSDVCSGVSCKHVDIDLSRILQFVVEFEIQIELYYSILLEIQLYSIKLRKSTVYSELSNIEVT